MKLFKHKKNNQTIADTLKTKITVKIYSEEEFRRIIDRERARADRTDHQFSLILLDLGFTNDHHNTNRLVLQKIYYRMRRIDEIGWYEPRRIGVILPYTSAQGAQKFAESLCNSFSPPMGECFLNVYTYDAGQTK